MSLVMRHPRKHPIRRRGPALRSQAPTLL